LDIFSNVAVENMAVKKVGTAPFEYWILCKPLSEFRISHAEIIPAVTK
jgi:hypothetical protein